MRTGKARSLVRHAVHPGLKAVLRRLEVDDAILADLADREFLEDEAIPDLAEPELEARYLERACVFEEPRFERRRETLSVGPTR